METINIILGCFASIVSIFAAIIGLINNNELKKISNKNSNNRQKSNGDNNTLVNGDSNKVER